MKKLIIRPIGLTFFLLLALSPFAAAEEIVLPVGQQGADNASLDRPRNGTSKDTVLQQFGEPMAQHGPVGEPPISSWEYPAYTVYFEHDKVLHSVLKPTGQQRTKDN